MQIEKQACRLTSFLGGAVVFFILSLGGCSGGGDDIDAFDAYLVEPGTADNCQRCVEDSEGSLPRWVQFSSDGLRLTAGLGVQDEFYRFSVDDDSDIKRIDLDFDENDWWPQMANNYASETEIPATMTYNGETLEYSVGVRFKGNTSYTRNNTEKKSFNISVDYIDASQDIHGYDTLNLNCAWGDNTFMREVIFEHINRRYIPAVSTNYVDLYINGEYWGIYINSQQLDGNFTKEWFTSSNGARWRSAKPGGGGIPGGDQLPDGDVPPGDGQMPGGMQPPGDGAPPPGTGRGGGGLPPVDGDIPDDLPPPGDGAPPGGGGRGGGGPGGGGGGGGFGNGTGALNYLGDSPEDYTAHYDLQRFCWSDPWDDMIYAAFALEDTPSEEMESEISDYLDLDGTLWFLVMENIFADEDGYINKGAMDYYLYWDDVTGLMVPLEYDGNSVLLEGNNRLTWTPFYRADNSSFPLLHKLLNVPSIRQRYLAHMRTVLNESFDEANMMPMIDAYALKIGPYIEADPKAFITDFTAGVDELKYAVATRISNLWSNEELDVTGLAISDVKWIVGTDEYETPSSSDTVDEVIINATVADLENGGGIASVYAYAGEGVVGAFTMVQMFDDGAHGDGPAGDGVYGVALAEEAPGVRTRFYIEAVAGDAPGTRTYFPSGAAHDVFTFQVN